MAAAAHWIGPENEWQAAINSLREVEELTRHWVGTQTELEKLDGGVLSVLNSLWRLIATLDRQNRRPLADQADEFTGAAEALLGFEKDTTPANLSPLHRKHLSKSRQDLWLDTRRALHALIEQVEDLGPEDDSSGVPS
jgi:hypothetical protein